MTLTATKTVGEIAVSAPSTTREFEKLGIDYCCGGSRTLGEACASANISVDESALARNRGHGARSLTTRALGR